MTANALRFLLLTAQRKSEVMGLPWNEIDLGAGLWTLPAERAKSKREHTIPLSPSALAIVQEQHPYRHVTDGMGIQILHNFSTALAERPRR